MTLLICFHFSIQKVKVKIGILLKYSFFNAIVHFHFSIQKVIHCYKGENRGSTNCVILFHYFNSKSDTLLYRVTYYKIWPKYIVCI